MKKYLKIFKSFATFNHKEICELSTKKLKSLWGFVMFEISNSFVTFKILNKSGSIKPKQFNSLKDLSLNCLKNRLETFQKFYCFTNLKEICEVSKQCKSLNLKCQKNLLFWRLKR